VIVLEGITKRFGMRTALDAFDVEVRAGEVVALVGPNGAGKSTALRILTGIVRPDAGSGRLNGFDVVREPERARALVGYVPQRLAFADHVTVADLCRLVAGLRGAPAGDAFRTLDEVVLGERRTSRVRDLSGGQRQRLALALALIGRPRAMVLDEPSISLDAEGAGIVCAAIASARARGAAVLFSSHQVHEVASLADRVVVLVDGQRRAEAGSGDLRDAGDFETFYRSAVRSRSGDAA
jgi:ABC-type multidrug transport system ATPase subunit